MSRRYLNYRSRKPQWIKWLPVLSLGMVLTWIGWQYERKAQKRYRDRFLPPGRIYQVKGRSMHLLCMGERRQGEPLVVLEAGHGSWSSCWQKVMPEVARFARVCAYDRPGYGWSDPVRDAARPERMVADLRELLLEAGETGPYLLVGHSMGGALARLFATLHAGGVVGMVWVDSVEEDLPAYLPLGRWMFGIVCYGAQLAALLAEVGLLRFSGINRMIARYPSVDNGWDALTVLEQVSQPGYMRVLAAETVTLSDRSGWEGVRKHFGSLPVISLEALYSETPPYAIPAGFWQRFRAGWHAMHDDLSVRADNLRRIPVASGHVIMNEQPELVVGAIRSLLNEVDPAGKAKNQKKDQQF